MADCLRFRRVGEVPENDFKMKREDIDKAKSPRKLTKRLRQRCFVKEHLIDYTTNSNLHGLKYIGEKERTFPEKIYWLFTSVSCVVICGIMIWKTWTKWNGSPTIVTLAENPMPVWMLTRSCCQPTANPTCETILLTEEISKLPNKCEVKLLKGDIDVFHKIPFPAVTVCFQTKAMRTKFDFMENHYLYYRYKTHRNLTEEERNLYEDVSMVCDYHLAPADGPKYCSGLDIVNNIIKVAPNITDAFYGCQWQDIFSENCSDLFSPVITEEGLCYTFNTLSAEELLRLENLHAEYPYMEPNKATPSSWSLEEGYSPAAPFKVFPSRSGSGVNSGLSFLLKFKGIDLDYLCKGPVQGFKILLHNPAEFPRISQNYFRISLATEVVVAIRPKTITTSDGLRSFDPIRRQCYFPTERYLRYFKVYTQANCEIECLSNFTYTRCGCVHFGMPRGPNMNVCNSGSVQCLQTSRIEIVTIKIKSEFDGQTSNDTDENLAEALNVSTKCNCLPACTSIEYEAEISQNDYDWRGMYNAYGMNKSEDLNYIRYTPVTTFFKEAQFISSQRAELYGLADILASCGGLLGLFMGFSILSVAEIIYFATLRVTCKHSNKKIQKQAKNNMMEENANETAVVISTQ